MNPVVVIAVKDDDFFILFEEFEADGAVCSGVAVHFDLSCEGVVLSEGFEITFVRSIFFRLPIPLITIQPCKKSHHQLQHPILTYLQRSYYRNKHE